jgi:serine/threonine protein kinase
MTPERYQQIGQLYHDALEIEPAARAGWLRTACAGNAELRQQVETLLAAHAQARDFLDAPILGLANETAAEPSAARRLGPYQIHSRIGRGGMGEVFLATDTRLGRKIALKLLPARFTGDAERVRRFKQEARAASALNHPNILTVFEIGEADGAHFIATEFVDGETLRSRASAAPMTLGEILDAAIQTAGALAAAHDAGIIHRDIKPENLMLRRDGYVKVLDFGLAKLIEGRSEVRERKLEDRESRIEDRDRSLSFNDSPSSILHPPSTTPGTLLGTIAYISPEQARGEDVDGRGDLFSLGVVLYELLTGQTPFAAASTAEMLAAILHDEAPPLTRFAPDAPRELERIVARLLARSRADRYPDAARLLRDLKTLQSELAFAARLRSGADEIADYLPPPSALLPAPASRSSDLRKVLEPVGGAAPLDSGFYIVRPTDEKFAAAIERQDSIVLVKGARQVGKTSLLARGLQQAREAGARVVLTDFQTLSAENLESLDRLMLAFASGFADQLDLAVSPDEVWKSNRSPGVNFEQYLRREVLLKLDASVVWGLDEVDRLFTCAFGSEVFGLFRSWHNKRALDPQGPWKRLTLAIAYATEAHLFITDLNQSPFNVGTRLQLDDFTLEQIAELNERHASPLQSPDETARFFRLLSGHPYLVRRGLHEMVTNNLSLADLEARADSDEGPFGDHLHRLLISLQKDAELCDIVRGLLTGQPCPTPDSFYRLRSAGLAIGDSTRDAQLRCELYATYLEKHLL